MTASGGSISVDIVTHPLGLILIPFKVGSLYGLNLILNTGFPISCLTPGVRDTLAALGHVRPLTGRMFRLGDLRLEGHALPDLDVRVNAGVARLGADGVVGLNFFDQFHEVCFDVETRRLTLWRRL